MIPLIEYDILNMLGLAVFYTSLIFIIIYCLYKVFK